MLFLLYKLLKKKKNNEQNQMQKEPMKITTYAASSLTDKYSPCFS